MKLFDVPYSRESPAMFVNSASLRSMPTQNDVSPAAVSTIALTRSSLRNARHVAFSSSCMVGLKAL